MTTELLDCGHPHDKGQPFDSTGRMGWKFVLSLDGKRKLCAACAALETLDCGHARGAHSPMSAGYGKTPEGARICYACCAEHDKAEMIREGRITLYLVQRKRESGLTEWLVINWPGSLVFPVKEHRRSKHGGGFGSQRTDAWFNGPDGYVWHAINRGDMQIARCRRTKEKIK